ncbi:YciI family protein [Amycolatopsis magusensis]|uniref:YciI family protein n=1 Tax=Amycolatopsis magusensis TaxID=882444 RepID=UPI003C30AA28
MRYLMMSNPTGETTNPNLEAEMGAWIEELTASGVLLATGGLAPTGIEVRESDGEVTVTDGPFAEAKESVAGFALVEVRTEEEVVEIARRFVKMVGNSRSVIQQVFA